ncbi:hypothetical protein EHM76_06085, partial [bacterium]
SGAERRRDAHNHPSFACKHNLQYWRGLPYLAFGAGAHGYANGYRYANALRIKTYIDRLAPDDRLLNTVFPLSPAAVNHHKQSTRDDRSEFMLTGLRLTQAGVSAKEFQARFGQSMFEIYGTEIDELLKLGLIEYPSPIRAERSNSEDEAGRGARGEGIRLTKRGRLLGNQVFMRFI